jgi:predicted Ser/Thr protein kinase
MNNLCDNCQCPIPPGIPSGMCPTCLIALANVPTADLPNNQFVPAGVAELQGRIPGIELNRLIGRGGMGAVYHGRQTNLGREVAVKILPPSMSKDPVFLSRFQREAHALAKLDHPNIVTVFGSGIADGLCYIVMEYIDGTTLRQAMSANAIDPESSLKIVPQICDALAYAHDHGIVHRDIKPENILLGVGGKVKVVDFGLAKLSDDDRTHTMLTATGARLGTLRYMAPEQLDGTAVDHRADVYSLGVVFYEMLTGQVPMGQFAMPSEKVGVDPKIDDVIMRTLCREPGERYQHVSDVENELKSISEGTTDGAWTFGSRVPFGRQWKSQATLFGWPVVHVAFGINPRTGEKLVAKGIIAIGDIAIGGIASGGLSFGIVSIGGLALGINAFGGLALGLQTAFGGLSIGGLAFGGLAIGLIAAGGAAVGGLAFGGAATGYVAIGGRANGTYELETMGKWNPPEFADSVIAMTLADARLPLFVCVAAVMLMLGPNVLVAGMALTGYVRSRARGIVDQKSPLEIKQKLVMTMVLVCVMTVIVPVLYAVQSTNLNRMTKPVVQPSIPWVDRPSD